MKVEVSLLPLKINSNHSILFLGNNQILAESYIFFLQKYTNFFHTNNTLFNYEKPELIQIDNKTNIKKIDTNKKNIFFSQILSLSMQKQLMDHLSNNLQIITSNTLTSSQCTAFSNNWLKIYNQYINNENCFLSNEIMSLIDNLFILEQVIKLRKIIDEKEIISFLANKHKTHTNPYITLKRLYLLKIDKIT